jgi:hypothetical protein
MYTNADLFKELDERFDPSVRKTFDHYGGLPFPLFVLIVNIHPQTGKRYDAPTPCPLQFEFAQGQRVTSYVILENVKRMVILTEAVASLVAYPTENGVKIHTELVGETHEWIIPVIADAKQKAHRFLGSRIDFAHGTGAHAKLLDDLDQFGGLFDKTSASRAEA